MVRDGLDPRRHVLARPLGMKKLVKLAFACATAVTAALIGLPASVDCPSGYTAIAGGFYASNPDGSVSTSASVEESVPVGTSSWVVEGFTPPHTKMVALAQCLR